MKDVWTFSASSPSDGPQVPQVFDDELTMKTQVFAFLSKQCAKRAENSNACEHVDAILESIEKQELEAAIETYSDCTGFYLFIRVDKVPVFSLPKEEAVGGLLQS